MNTAENIIESLLEGELTIDAILEDRVDTVLKSQADKIPGNTPLEKRQILEKWMTFDPTRNKKYLPWMLKQFVEKKTQWDDHDLDVCRDMLIAFERLLTLPAFKGVRDIQQYDMEKLIDTVNQHAKLKSRSERKVTGGIEVVNKLGDLELWGFKDAMSLAHWAWQAYRKENPNWNRPTIFPSNHKDPYFEDHKWCIRNPTRGEAYIKGVPDKLFYMVMKHGWPYVGMVFGEGGSQVVNLDNQGIGMSVAEEIYPLLKPVIDKYAKHKWKLGSAASSLFDKLRVIRGEIKPGETIQGGDYSGSSVKSLPDDLTVTSDFDISDTPITVLPRNLKVAGYLSIKNTAITELPEGLTVGGRLNLSGSKITSLPQGMSVGELDISHTKISELPSGLDVKVKLSMQGTPITHLPDDLKVKGVEYSAPLTLPEIKRFFFHYRLPDLWEYFVKDTQTKRAKAKLEPATPEKLQEEWKVFQVQLKQYFQDSPVIHKAVSAIFKEAAPSKGGDE